MNRMYTEEVIQIPDINPQNYLDIDEQQDNKNSNLVHRYGFTVGELGFLFPEQCLGEIITSPAICALPFTHHWLSGVFNLRGNLVPVFDFAELLFQEPISTPAPYVLVLGTGKQAIAVTLNTPPELITNLQPISVENAPIPELLQAFVVNAYQRQNTIWLNLQQSPFFTFLAENAKRC